MLARVSPSERSARPSDQALCGLDLLPNSRPPLGQPHNQTQHSKAEVESADQLDASPEIEGELRQTVEGDQGGILEDALARSKVAKRASPAASAEQRPRGTRTSAILKKVG
jgi:hypothetical protein